MGAKTALLAFVDGDLPAALRAAGRSQAAGLLPGGSGRIDVNEAEAIVRRLSPGYEVAPPRRYRMGTDGTLHEVGIDDLV
jgi:hypothetical protein